MDRIMHWSLRRTLLILMVPIIGSLVIYNYAFDKSANFSQQELIETVAKDPEFIKYFGENIQSLNTLDTDSDGTPDYRDSDDDNDGIKDKDDTDDDNDGVADSSDPSAAIVGLVAASQNSVTDGPLAQGADGEDGEDGLDGRDGVDGEDGLDGTGTDGTDGSGGSNGTDGTGGTDGNNGGDGSNGNDGNNGLVGPAGPAGAAGPKGDKGDRGDTGATGATGATGTVGVVTDDGVVQTTLTGADLNIQLLLAAGSGLEKSGAGLSLTRTCATNEVLKWDGAEWNCASDDGGISYTAGSGITIASGVISSVLGTAIETGELADDAVTSVKLADGSVVTSKIVDDAVLTAKIADGNVTTGKLADASVATAKLIDSAVTFGKIQNLTANSLFGNPTGSAAAGTNVTIGPGLTFNAGALENAGILAVGVSGPLQSTGGQSPTLSFAQATGLVDGYLGATDFATFAAKENALTFNGNGAFARSGNVINATTCASNEILKWNGSAWACANDNNGAATAGDLTSATSGITITNGGNAVLGSGTSIAIATANGSANGLLSSVDWNTFDAKEDALTFTGNGLFSRVGNTISSTTCSNNQIVRSNGVSWVCSNDTDTTYAAGTGLSLAGNTFNNTGILSVAVSGPLQATGGQNPTFSIVQATGLVDGYLSATDFASFAAKQAALPTGLSTQYLKGDLTLGTLDTSEVAENGNLYFTNGRADGRITIQKGAANGLATLDGTGKIPTSQLPALAITNTFVVADQTAMLALTANQGDIAVRTDTSETYVLSATPASVLGNWQELLTPTSPVLSVNGQTGAITLTSSNITEGSNLYFTDARARGALSVTGPLTYNSGTGVLGIDQANTSTGGFLASADWNAFNAKENALTFNGRGIFTRAGNAVTAVACSTGETLKYDGTTWNCSADSNTTYSAGTGLSLAGTTFNLSDTSVSAGTFGTAASVPVFTVDAQGRLTGVTNTAISGLTTSNLSGTAGITNAQLANPGITFALGTSGVDANWGVSTVNLGGTATLNIPDASASARGLINTGAQTIAGNKTLSGNTNLSGTLALNRGADYSNVGSTNDVNFGNTSLVRLTGASAQTITGIAGGTDGRLLTIINAASQAATISNESVSSTDVNRIRTGTGADLNLAADASLSLVYDSGASRWRVVGGTGGSGGGYSSLDIANDADGGAIGTAVGTVDTYTNFNMAQTTASQTFTIPSPTNTTTTRGKIITINNTGSANFTIGGITIPAGSYGSAFVWNGTVWNPINAASNVAFNSVRADITSGQTTASTTSVDVTGGSFTISSAGLYELSYSVPFAGSTAGVPATFEITDSSNAVVANTTVRATSSNAGVRVGTANVGDVNTANGCASSGAIISCSNTSGVGNNRYTVNYADLGYAPIVVAQYRDAVNTGTISNDMSIMPVVGTPTNTSAQFFLEESASNGQNVTINILLIDPTATDVSRAVLTPVTTNLAAGTYKLRVKSGNAASTITVYNNTTQGAGFVTASQVGGNVPAIGQITNFINARSTSGNSGASGTITFAGGDIVANNGFSLASNAFTATSSGTYRVRLEVQVTSASGNFESVNLQLRRNGSAVFTTPTTNVAEIDGYGAFGVPHSIDQVITLSAGDNVSFAWGGSGGSKVIGLKDLNITQLGSSAFTTVSMSALSAALANNSLDNAAFAQTWNWNSLTTGTGLTSNANALTSGILQQLATSSTAFTGSLLNLSSTGNAVTSTGSLAKLDIVGSSNAAKGLQINNAGTGDGINVASTGAGFALKTSGAVAFAAGTNFASTATAHNAAFGNTSLIRITGSTAMNLTGIKSADGTDHTTPANEDGRLLTILNTSSAITTIANNNSGSVAANRIITGTGADLSLAAGAAIQMVYDSTSTATGGTGSWRVIGGTGGSGGSSFSSSTITSNFPTGGAIGTAAATVDAFTSFILSGQTTAGQALSLPSPTVTTAGRIVTVTNTSTASFTMYTTQLSASSPSASFIWNGSSWNPIGTSSNVASEFGEVVLGSNMALTTGTLTTVVSTPVLPAGTWKIEAQVAVSTDTNAQTFAAGIYSSDNLTTNISAAAQLVYAGGPSSGTSTNWSTFVVSDGTKSYLLRVRENNTNATVLGAQDIGAVNTGAVTKLVYTKVSGNAAVTGQSVDYVSRETSAGTTYAANATVAYGTAISGNIPYNTTLNQNFTGPAGTFRLTAGKTYQLTSFNRIITGTNSSYFWYNNTATAPIPGVHSIARNTDAQPAAISIFTPTVDTVVSVRNGSSSAEYQYGYADIVQIGSTAFTTVSMSTLSAALASNALDNTNYTQTWDWSTLSTGTGLTSNANALTSGILQQLATSSTAFTGSLLNLSSTGNAVTSTGSLAKLDIVGSTNAAKGLQINNAGTGDGINIASTGTGLGANIGGAVAFRSGTTYTTPGSANDVVLSNASFVRLDTSGAAQTLTGIAGGVDGKLLTLTNADATLAVTLVNQSTSSAPANRIVTGTGTDLTIVAGASVNLIYDATDSRWRVVGGTGGSGGGFSSLDIANDADGGNIGTAAATVDQFTNFNMAQTTASQTFTIPSPTNTTSTRGKIITVNNTGSANFTIGGITVPAGSYGSAFVWNGTVWNPLNAASNVAASYAQINRTASQTTDCSGGALGVNDRVCFSNVAATTGTDITVDLAADANQGRVLLKAGKTYRLFGSVGALSANGGADNYVSFAWYNITAGAEVTGGSRGSVEGSTEASADALQSYAEAIITPSTDTYVELRILALGGNTTSIGSANYGLPRAYVEVVSGNAPVVGQSVDFAQFRLAANTTAYSANANIPQGTTVTTTAGNIPVTSAGLITLTAGKTYRFDTQIALSNAGSNAYLYYGLFDTNDVRIPNSPTGVAASTELGLSGISSAPSFGFVYTPTTNQTVKFRTDGVGGSPIINSGNTYFTVTQLGSSSVTSLDIAGEYGEVRLPSTVNITGGNTTPATAIDVMSFTLPSAGVWKVTYIASVSNNAGGSNPTVGIFDSTNAFIANSNILGTFTNTGGSTVVNTSTGVTFVTTSGPAVYRMRAWSGNGTGVITGSTGSNQDLTKVVYEKISGFRPTIGQSVEAATFNLGSNWSNSTGNFVNTWQTAAATGTTTITSSGTNFVIPAGKAFTANLSLVSQSGVHSTFSVRDVTGGGPGVQLGSGLAIGMSEGPNWSSSSAQAVYIPASGTARTISVRLDGVNTTNPTLNSNYSSITFTQAGTTAMTGVAMSSLAAALASNALDNTSFAQTWNWSSLAAGTSGLTFGNTVGGTTQNNVITILGGNNTGVAASQLITFRRTDGTVIGSVSQNAASTVAYNTTSDQRLKSDITDSELGLDALLKIKVRDYSYASDPTGKKLQGFVAQELAEVYGQAVTVGSDQVDENGLLTNPWQVDYGKLTPLLVKGMQELNMKIEANKVSIDGQNVDGLSDVNSKLVKITEGLTQVSGDVVAINTALDTVNKRLEGLDTRLAALEGKTPTTVEKTTTVQNTPVTNVTQQIVKDTAQYGSVKILKGKIGVKVTFTTAYKTAPAVFITPLSGAEYTLETVSTTEFVIKLKEPATADQGFNWMAAEYEPGTNSGGDQIDAPVVPVPAISTSAPAQAQPENQNENTPTNSGQ